MNEIPMTKPTATFMKIAITLDRYDVVAIAMGDPGHPVDTAKIRAFWAVDPITLAPIWVQMPPTCADGVGIVSIDGHAIHPADCDWAFDLPVDEQLEALRNAYAKRKESLIKALVPEYLPGPHQPWAAWRADAIKELLRREMPLWFIEATQVYDRDWWYRTCGYPTMKVDGTLARCATCNEICVRGIPTFCPKPVHAAVSPFREAPGACMGRVTVVPGTTTFRRAVGVAPGTEGRHEIVGWLIDETTAFPIMGMEFERPYDPSVLGLGSKQARGDVPEGTVFRQVERESWGMEWIKVGPGDTDWAPHERRHHADPDPDLREQTRPLSLVTRCRWWLAEKLGRF